MLVEGCVVSIDNVIDVSIGIIKVKVLFDNKDGSFFFN